MRYTDEDIKNRRKKKEKVKKIFATMIYALLIPVLIYNISVIAQAVLNPDKTPSFFGLKTYVIVSGSMQPELEIGDIVVVKDVKEEELKKEDIISFREGQSVVTHRIIGIEDKDNQKYFKTKGDNNNAEDHNLIDMSVIEGKVVTTLKFVGKIALMLRGKLTIIWIVIIYYIYFSRCEKIKNKKEMRRLKRLEYEKRRLENENK